MFFVVVVWTHLNSMLSKQNLLQLGWKYKIFEPPTKYMFKVMIFNLRALETRQPAAFCWTSLGGIRVYYHDWVAPWDLTYLYVFSWVIFTDCTMGFNTIKPPFEIICCTFFQKRLRQIQDSVRHIMIMILNRYLGGGFKYLSCSSLRGEWSNLTSIFFKGVETTN